MLRLLAVLTLLTCQAASSALVQDAGTPSRVAALGRINSAFAPTFSPDGRKLAFLSTESGSPQIWIKDLPSGTLRQLTRLADPVGSVFWSPRGDLIAYSVAPGGGLNTQIWVMAADGSGARRLTAGGKDNNGLAGWTRDGTALMVDTNKDNADARDPALLDVATGRWRMLASGKGLGNVADVRGGRATVGRLLGRGDSDLYAIDLATGGETLLTSHRGKAESDWANCNPMVIPYI